MEKIIIFNQDIALLVAHILIMSLREPRLFSGFSPELCTVVAMALQYFFTAAYTFMLLEGLQMMTIVARVKLSGSLMPWYLNMAVGWGMTCLLHTISFLYFLYYLTGGPLIILAVSAPLVGNEYSTSWTCWGDLKNSFNCAIMVSLIAVCSTTAVVVESAGMMGRNDPESLRRLSDPTQLFSAL